MRDELLEEFDHRNARRHAWREHREAMEARPEGKRWRGHVRGQLYGAAQRAHEVLRPTRPFRRGAERALRLELTELTVSLPDLPADFDGYRILHLTDLHLDNIEDTAAVTAERVAEVESDLCVITGDIRDNIHAPVPLLIERLGHITTAVRAGDGILSVLGNHDSAAMVPPMEDLGIHVLLNETVTFSRGSDVVHITGLDDVHRFRTAAAHAALDAAPDGFCVALVHSPCAADLASQRHRLYFTGHTHGGQFCFPERGPIRISRKARSDQASGAWRHGDMVGYTSRGIGTSILPFRLHCPGEIVRVTLKRGSEAVSIGGTAADLW